MLAGKRLADNGQARIAVLAGAGSRSAARLVTAATAAGLPIEAVCWYAAPQSEPVVSSNYSSAWYPPTSPGPSHPSGVPSGVPAITARSWDDVTAAIRTADADLVLLLGMPVVPAHVLNIAKLGVLNAHNGALPSHRGMDAVGWALLHNQPIVCSLHLARPAVDAQARLHAALARMAAATRPSLSEFDLVRGLTGLGAHLLHRDNEIRHWFTVPLIALAGSVHRAAQTYTLIVGTCLDCGYALSVVTASVHAVIVRCRLLARMLRLAAVMVSCGYPTVGGQKLCDLGFLPAHPIVTGPNVLGTMWAQCGPVLWHAAWPHRRYICVAQATTSASLLTYLRGWVAVPASIRAMPKIPADTGAGPTLRWEGRWVLRPDRGWRSWRWSPPLHVNRQLTRNERDAAADWALDVIR